MQLKFSTWVQSHLKFLNFSLRSTFNNSLFFLSLLYYVHFALHFHSTDRMPHSVKKLQNKKREIILFNWKLVAVCLVAKCIHLKQ